MDGDQSMDDEEQDTMEESRGEVEESEDVDADEYSEMSDGSDVVVEPSVQEDMDKFQDTFKGIKDRFRLINRIGEGE
jgi:cell division control protein 7